MQKKSTIVAHGNMKSEENTNHQVNNTFCGNIARVEVSRMEESFGHRVYACDGCGLRWKFADHAELA